MAQIRTLSWNIQAYGPSKFGPAAPNSAALIGLIAATAVTVGANVICLTEVKSSTAHGIRAALIGALGGAWTGIVMPTNPHDSDFYAVFWNPANFAPVTLTSGSAAAGLVGISVPGLHAPAQDYPNNFADSNGRRPGYVIFRTTDTAVNFAVTAYHAPTTGKAILGMQRLGAWLAGLTVDRHGGGMGEAVRAVATGDYNLDQSANAGDYAAFIAATGTHLTVAGAGVGAPASASDTMLLDVGSTAVWAPPANSIGYRRPLCLDNIMASGVVVAGAPGPVLDLVTMVQVGQPLAAQAAAFNLGASRAPTFPNSDYIMHPIGSNFRGFVLTRYGVSDHLPVLSAVTL